MLLKKKVIIALGYDLSTTELKLVGRTADGEEIFVSLPMRGATIWLGQWAFDLAELPGLFTEALEAIKAQGFEFAPGVVISGSVRQHDMALLGTDMRPIIPALSWQCVVAEEEVAWLKGKGAEAIVGRLEPRLILPKLLWALKQEPGLEDRIRLVMTTGDFVAGQLNGAFRLSSSEALSNGLLNQGGRVFPWELIDNCGLKGWWFSNVVQSGQIIMPSGNGVNYLKEWDSVRVILPDCKVAAGLGDNHAGAVGSGLTGRDTIVISAGTSGTVVRACENGAVTAGRALRFEYYDDILLLRMMADCASLYRRYVDRFAGGLKHPVLDKLATDETTYYPIRLSETTETPFPDAFHQWSVAVQVKSLQYSIAHRLVELSCQMQDEVPGQREAIKRVVLTGGLTRSAWFRECLVTGLRTGGFQGQIHVSSRVGPLANQAATLGALINAMVGGGLYPNLGAAIKELCPMQEI